VNSLDLKFMVHYGEYFSRWVREHHELVGLAPIFVQKREWKAAIAKSTDWLKVSLPLSRPAVWEWLNDPQKRNQWYPSLLRWSARLRPGGRTGPGASNHCNHGVGNVIEKIIDWRPFDYYTVEMRAMPGNISLLMTIRLDALSEEKTQAHGYLSMQNPRILAGPISALSARFLENRIQQIGYLVSKK
jgi:hypothetical protein